MENSDDATARACRVQHLAIKSNTHGCQNLSKAMLHSFAVPAGLSLPDGFDSPFRNSPSAIARAAAQALQQQLETYDWQQTDFFAEGAGKIFGVLVVRDAEGALACLHGFSGQVGGQWQWPGFVPPAFDLEDRQSYLPQAMRQLEAWSNEIKAIESDADYLQAQQQLEQGERSMREHTTILQAELVARKAERREARVHADEQTLLRLQREGEADARVRAQDKKQSRERLLALNTAVKKFSDQIEDIREHHNAICTAVKLSEQVGYTLPNAEGQMADIAALFGARETLPGTGDCAGPKLLSYAYTQGLQPMAMAEFWWGAEPLDGVRHHRVYAARAASWFAARSSTTLHRQERP